MDDITAREIWDDATNAVCQVMQDLGMCKCPNGGCVAATVQPSESSLRYYQVKAPPKPERQRG